MASNPPATPSSVGTPGRLYQQVRRARYNSACRSRSSLGRHVRPRRFVVLTEEGVDTSGRLPKAKTKVAEEKFGSALTFPSVPFIPFLPYSFRLHERTRP